MPTYEYLCPDGHAFDKFQKMNERPRAKCPTCGKLAVRKISGGAGLVFKGSGFYITDYGKDGKGPRKPATEGAAPAAAKEAGGTTPKPESAPAAAPTAPKKPAPSGE
ncbi:MAG TPA: zinc ribbon domain-containing protein [Gemmatimonadales bacterium]|nr:zinc ribbon domain-containing protein [Gemmatimonadales bacterium]